MRSLSRDAQHASDNGYDQIVSTSSLKRFYKPVSAAGIELPNGKRLRMQLFDRGSMKTCVSLLSFVPHNQVLKSFVLFTGVSAPHGSSVKTS
jgi:hypothetical protein